MTTEDRQKSIANRTIFCGDNLDVLRGFNDNSIDLIYLDPPFNKNKQFTAPIGTTAEGASFKDYWGMEDLKNAWILDLRENHSGLFNFLAMSEFIADKTYKCYLIYMAMRLLEMKRILKDTGSIYLHCDSTMSHFLKLLMDCIFGGKNFRNEIIWSYTGGTPPKKDFARKNDIIFRYVKNYKSDYYFNPVYEKYDEKTIKRFDKVDEKGRYKLNILKGKEPYKTYMNPNGKRLDCIWEIPIVMKNDPQNTDYPTQKPLALLERIIKASCPPNGIVLDPFCGCATTCVASERLGVEWIGIDISKLAYVLVKDRLEKDVVEKGFMNNPDVIRREDIPQRTDIEFPKLDRKNMRDTLYGKQGGDCKGCKQHFIKEVMEIDHIIPQSKGGQDNEDNLQLLCSYCNRVKGDRPMEYLIAKYKEIIK